MLTFWIAAPADAAPAGAPTVRVALVIANATYRHVPRLPNPPADGAIVGAALRRAGFAVVTVADADRMAMERAIRDFGERAEGADMAVIYYAGHGIEVNRRNFLIPVDARLVRDRDVDIEAVALDTVLAQSEGARVRIVMLDACRENPFATSMARTGAGRSIGRGLTRVEPAGDTLVLFAAKDGAIAADGDGSNSPFATAVAKRVVEPGVEINFVFRRIRDDVLRATDNRQEPFVYGSFSSTEIYLMPGAITAVTPAIDSEGLFWQGALKTDQEAGYREYLRRWPQGTFAALANANVARFRPPPAVTALPAGADRWGMTRAQLEILPFDRLVTTSRIAERIDEARAAAMSGDGAAALLLGWAYQEGLGVSANESTALEWLRRAADIGLPRAQANMAKAYAAGQGVAVSSSEAEKWYRRAIAAGSPIAMFNMGDRYAEGEGVAKNMTTALQWYERSANLGMARAMASAGYAYMQRAGNDRATAAESRAAAIRWFTRAAADGDARGMAYFAYAYRNGDGVAKDEAKELDWLRRAADAGDAAAANDLGLAYLLGRGVPKSAADSFDRFRQAADGGDALGMFNLGIAYERGIGTAVDLAQAKFQYGSAAALGLNQAQSRLNICEGGRGPLPQPEGHDAPWTYYISGRGPTCYAPIGTIAATAP